MGKLQTLFAELEQLEILEDKIIQRVWDQSTEAKDLEGTVLNEENIHARVEVLAQAISTDFPNAKPVIVGLLDGATPFASLLCEALKRRKYEFKYSPMSASSYGKELVSGEVTMGALPKVKLYNKTVIVIDDVCDSGKTFLKINNAFMAEEPKSVTLMALVDKMQARPHGCNPDYVGFTLSPDAFIVGEGLDYCGGLRNESSIRAVTPASLPDASEQVLLARKAEVEKEIEAIIKARKQTQKLSAPGQSIFASNTKSTPTVEKADTLTMS